MIKLMRMKMQNLIYWLFQNIDINSLRMKKTNVFNQLRLLSSNLGIIIVQWVLTLVRVQVKIVVFV